MQTVKNKTPDTVATPETEILTNARDVVSENDAPTSKEQKTAPTTRKLQVGDPVVTVKNLRTFFYTNKRVNHAVNGVSFTIRCGKTLCIVGESGCGKSVTATSIMRLLPTLSRIEQGSEIIYHSEEGDVKIHELTNNCKKMREMRGTEMAMIFQDPMTSLNPVLSVGYQIKENLHCHDKSMKRNELNARAIGSLKEMGISLPEQRVKEYPHQYSGGMRQRAMIAMAMVCRPKVLLADEPTTALDVTIQAQIFDLMNDLKKYNNTAIMLITHDMGVVAELADDIAVMYMGHIVESGTADDVLRTPAHPYTKALLRSIPVLGKGKNQNLTPIRGSTPDPYNRPKGCQFYDRCDYATPECAEAMPEEFMCSETHMTRCIHNTEVLNDKR